jgi:hypothetical protein
MDDDESKISLVSIYNDKIKFKYGTCGSICVQITKHNNIDVCSCNCSGYKPPASVLYKCIPDMEFAEALLNENIIVMKLRTLYGR